MQNKVRRPQQRVRVREWKNSLLPSSAREREKSDKVVKGLQREYGG
ncbi:hypothetical protein H6F78_25520 [Coleofasciculus sp. FACHB-64]|nr:MULTISPECIES: hypothetical protein [unclassified Coleofasciculus]MBD1841491.1 hypothetical protein [Coleofasciculus sp. FACHB-501]MBD1877767.1 hypothetical protein [Coleofasciculus sp. FACHB-T130]MBD1889548.1 hypothetical protein [Coleofasciculus sp. FACHB-SPT9]MBD1894620.1 hypothetical protein [Coleofasciculus sp. FACHB-129]MBD1943025.1 hypothetical protein [Coleofasciculus sp. FACHB-712]